MVRAEVDNAPNEERSILAYLITSGRRAFAAEFNDRRLAPLVAKGILLKLAGTHSVLEWPYVVQDDVWEYLQDNRDRYFFKNVSEVGDPFHWRSRTRFGSWD